MKNKWYTRFPTLSGNDIYFTTGTEIFKVSKDGGTPELCFLGVDTFSCLTAHKDKIACVSKEDGGPDLYLFDTETKELERLTFFERRMTIVKFCDEGLWFISSKDCVFSRDMMLYKIDIKTKEVTNCKIGPINWMDSNSQINIYQKYGYGYTNWKGYKGGSKGKIFKDENLLIDLPTNAIRPSLIYDRVYFLHDDTKSGNIYSCDLNGKDLTQHTFFEDFQVQDLIKSDNYLLFTIAGALGIFDTNLNLHRMIDLKGSMQHPEKRNFIPDPKDFLTNADTNGKVVTLSIRGSVYKAGVFSGGVKKLTKDLRFRISGLLDNEHTFAFQEPPVNNLVIFDNNEKEIKRFEHDFGKIHEAKPNKNGSFIAYSNHKHELSLIDSKNGQSDLVVKSKNGIHGFDWYDENYLVFSASDNANESYIAIYDIQTKKQFQITDSEFMNSNPSFDPNGEFITFLSNRSIQCVNDGLRFGLAFEQKTMPYIVSLKKNKNLMMPWVNKSEDEEDEDEKTIKKNTQTEEIRPTLEIDLDKIQQRIIPLPMPQKRYLGIHAIDNSKIILVSDKKLDDFEEDDDNANGDIDVETFCLKTLGTEQVYKGLNYFSLANNKQHCMFEENESFKISKFGEKVEENGYKKNATFDLNRIKWPIDTKQEWQQIIHELCWLLKEFYWSAQTAGVNLDKIFEKYQPYIENIRTRQELDDLMDEILGELGTSHAYISSSQETEHEKRGYLGASLEYKNQKYYFKKIFNSNLADNIISPLVAANANIEEGQILFAIDNVDLDLENTPEKLLFAKENIGVTLTVGTDENKQNVEIKTISLGAENLLAYRDWVESNRKYIHENSNNKIGYIHIPIMNKRGYKEFCQAYLKEHTKESIIIDVRNNPGGNISTLLLDQLKRKTVGLDITRWHGNSSIPHEASSCNYVLLINSSSCSDAEMFSHQFKMLKMGKVVGETTWGGVVGIWPRYRLVDNTLTTQPEFCTWFEDVGYDVENTGVMPDIEVQNSIFNPEKDYQLEKGLEEAMKLEYIDLEKLSAQTKLPKR